MKFHNQVSHPPFFALFVFLRGHSPSALRQPPTCALWFDLLGLGLPAPMQSAFPRQFTGAAAWCIHSDSVGFTHPTTNHSVPKTPPKVKSIEDPKFFSLRLLRPFAALPIPFLHALCVPSRPFLIHLTLWFDSLGLGLRPLCSQRCRDSSGELQRRAFTRIRSDLPTPQPTIPSQNPARSSNPSSIQILFFAPFAPFCGHSKSPSFTLFAAVPHQAPVRLVL
jgi:hypothetical protein